MMTNDQINKETLKLIDSLDRSWTLGEALCVLFGASIAITAESAEHPVQKEYGVIRSTIKNENGVFVATLRAVPHKMKFRGN